MFMVQNGCEGLGHCLVSWTVFQTWFVTRSIHMWVKYWSNFKSIDYYLLAVYSSGGKAVVLVTCSDVPITLMHEWRSARPQSWRCFRRVCTPPNNSCNSAQLSNHIWAKPHFAGMCHSPFCVPNI